MADVATKTSNKADQKKLVALIAGSKLSDEVKAAFTEKSDAMQARIDDTKGDDVSQETLDGICEDITTITKDVEVAISELAKVSELKKTYKVAVTGMSYGTNRVLKGGEVITTSKFGEERIKEWLTAGLIR